MKSNRDQRLSKFVTRLQVLSIAGLLAAVLGTVYWLATEQNEIA